MFSAQKSLGRLRDPKLGVSNQKATVVVRRPRACRILYHPLPLRIPNENCLVLGGVPNISLDFAQFRETNSAPTKLLPFLVNSLSLFWDTFGFQNGPKLLKHVSRYYKTRINLWIPFFCGFGALQLHPGSVPEPSEAVLDGLGPPKREETFDF